MTRKGKKRTGKKNAEIKIKRVKENEKNKREKMAEKSTYHVDRNGPFLEIS